MDGVDPDSISTIVCEMSPCSKAEGVHHLSEECTPCGSKSKRKPRRDPKWERTTKRRNHNDPRQEPESKRRRRNNPRWEPRTKKATREQGLTHGKTEHGGNLYQLRGRGCGPIHGYVFTRNRRMKRSLKLTTLKTYTF